MVRAAYDTDLTDEQWQLLEPLMPKPVKMGRPNVYPQREIINAIFYINKSGCSWRMLPHDLPSWRIVYFYFNQWSRNGLFQRINDELRRAVRIQEGRSPEPTAASIDSQSTKTTEAGGVRGYDAGKKVNGRKRHILVDVLGLVLVVIVHSAAIQDRDGARLLFEQVTAETFPNLDLVWADGAYAGALVEETEAQKEFEIEIVKRTDDIKGFVVLPKRWVVERTFAWLSRCRRMSKDYERTTESSAAFVHIAMTHIMLKRLA